MLTAQVEMFEPNIPEWKGLIDGHFEKLALDKDRAPLAPQWAEYRRREAMGQLMFVVLRDKGQMAGYWLAFIAPGLHYETCLTASLDVWNVLPEYQNGVASMILMRAVEREYRRRGVNRSFVGEKLHRPCGRLYRAFGYEPVETHYSKMIGG